MTPALPRPLQIGEFYCHRCSEFVKWVEREAHQKLRRRVAYRPVEERTETVAPKF